MVTDIFCSGYGIMVCIIYHSGNKQSIPKCGCLLYTSPATRRVPVLGLQLQGVLLRRRREAYISPWMEISLKWSSCGSCHDGSKCAILIFVGKVHNALHVEFTVKRTTEVIHNGNNGRFQRRVRGIFPPDQRGRHYHRNCHCSE